MEQQEPGTVADVDHGAEPTRARDIDIRAYAEKEREIVARLAEAEGWWFNGLYRESRWLSYGNAYHHAISRHMRRGVAEGKRLAKVLEIGFGEGAGLHWILDYMQVDPSMVTGIELFEDYVDDARKRWPDARFELVGPTFGGFLDWMEKEREKGEYYELIFARHVLQGNPNAPAFLRAVAGLLPENQLFTFIVPFKGKMYHYEPMDEVGMGWEGTPNEAAVRHKIAEHHATNIPITGFKWLPGSIGPELMKAKLRPVDHGERNACNSPRITESIAYCRRLP